MSVRPAGLDPGLVLLAAPWHMGELLVCSRARRAFHGQAPKLVPLIKTEFWSAV